MAALNLSRRLPPHKLAAEIRKAFSGIVTGSVKAPWIRAIEQKGPYRLHGDADLLEALEALVQSLIDQGRLKPHHPYPPVIFEKTS